MPTPCYVELGKTCVLLAASPQVSVQPHALSAFQANTPTPHSLISAVLVALAHTLLHQHPLHVIHVMMEASHHPLGHPLVWRVCQAITAAAHHGRHASHVVVVRIQMALEQRVVTTALNATLAIVSHCTVMNSE